MLRGELAGAAPTQAAGAHRPAPSHSRGAVRRLPSLPACLLLAVLLASLAAPSTSFFWRSPTQTTGDKRSGKARKVVFIFSKARSAQSMTTRLFDKHADFLHFVEPYAAWLDRKTAERSLSANVDFLERLVDCKLDPQEVYSVVAQGEAVPEGLKSQRLSSTAAAEQLSRLCSGRHVAVKTMRMSSLDAICQLQKRLGSRGDEVYVIDSYRDPRAVVASLLESAPAALAGIPELQRVKKMSESVCQHMTARYSSDSRSCKGLRKYSLQNEHFAEDPVTEGKKLYKFLGLGMPREVQTDLKGAEKEAAAATAEDTAAGNSTASASDGGVAEPGEGEVEGGASIKQKQWFDIMNAADGKQVLAVCQRIMPKDLFKMVFVA